MQSIWLGKGIMGEDKYLLSSVNNTLEILDLLSMHDALGVAEISKILKMGKSSVFKMLYTLEKKEYVQKTPDAKYMLGIKFAHYGSIVLDRQNEFSFIKPYLRKLRDRHNETAHLSVLDRDYNIIFIDKEAPSAAMQMSSRRGAKLPAYCAAMGKVLLAGIKEGELEKVLRSLELKKKTENTITDPDLLIKELEKVRIQGYAIDAEESEIGLVCYAAPIIDIHHNTVAAISISGPSGRMKQNSEYFIDSVRETALEISKAMGYIE